MMAMNDDARAIQRIVRAAADLRSFSVVELSEKANSKPATTRVVLKRLLDRWPGAITVEVIEADQGKDDGSIRYATNASFVEVQERYIHFDFQGERKASTEHVLTEFVELASQYLELAQSAKIVGRQRAFCLSRSELLLDKVNLEEARSFPKVKRRFAEVHAQLLNLKAELLPSKPLTKTELVAAVAEAMGLDKKTAIAALDAIAAVVSREVAAGGTVTLPGLGKVACKARPERMVRNPATGEQIKKFADKQVKFAIAKALKEVVNN